MLQEKKITGICLHSVLFFILLSIVCTFFNVVQARIFFYIAFYFTIIGFIAKCFNRNVIRENSFKWIFFAFFVLGLSKLIWFGWEYYGSWSDNKYNSYLDTGKRLVVASIIAWYVLSQLKNFHQHVLTLVHYVIIGAFVIATAVGLWQIAHDVLRVDFFQGRATDAAYMYEGLSLVVIFSLLSRWPCRINIILAVVVFLIAYSIILYTGTRNVIFSFPVIIILTTLVNARHMGLKFYFASFLLLGIFIYSTWSKFIIPGIDRTVDEYQSYQLNKGNQLTSLSSRIAMWQVGIAGFIDHPLGSTQEKRYQWAERYVIKTHRDSSAMDYIDIHLHNEFIEAASLQGIQGIVALGFFYIVLFWRAIKQRNIMMLSIMLCISISGLTDVIFISREQTIFFCLIIVISVLLNRGLSLALKKED